MKVLRNYLTSEITRSIVFVLAAFLALFAFFDLMAELGSIGHGAYGMQHAFFYLLLNIPSHIYELMPIAALIGTVWALAQFASNSEFTIMRASGMSAWRACRMLTRLGVGLVVLTFVFGEFVAPFASGVAEKMKLRVQGSSISREFRSGLWAKDVIRDRGASGTPIGSRFLNVHDVSPDGEMHGVKLYDLDLDFHLTGIMTAARAQYQGAQVWRLYKVTRTRFNDAMPDGVSPNATDKPVSIETMSALDLPSEITPGILSVLFADPNRMSAKDLAAYINHLAENNQITDRYEIAFWKKIIYPFAVLVMMALALPFAYMQVRSGGVSVKIFIGIMIGVSFQLLNSLFSHIGLLKAWPPLATAILPSLAFLLMAIIALIAVERR